MEQQLTPPTKLYDYVDETRIEAYPSLKVLPYHDTYVASEAHQPGGSFKVRGATNYFLAHDAPHGVTASAGSFGAGFGYAGEQLHRDTTVFVPENTPESKVSRIKSYGSRVIEVGSEYPETVAAAQQYSRDHNAPYASPYDDMSVIAGAVSLGHEIARKMGDQPTTMYAPVGGMGLLAGLATAASWYKNLSVVGVQYNNHNSLEQSLRAGEPTDARGELDPRCEGSAVRRIGALPFGVVAHYSDFLDGIVTVSPAEVGESLWHELILRDKLMPPYTPEIAYDGMPETTAVVAETGMRKWMLSGNARPGAHVAIRTGGNTDHARESALLNAYHDSLPRTSDNPSRLYVGAQAA